jgi:protein involved in polysaccharide export with SLBB domain
MRADVVTIKLLEANSFALHQSIFERNLRRVVLPCTLFACLATQAQTSGTSVSTGAISGGLGGASIGATATTTGAGIGAATSLGAAAMAPNMTPSLSPSGAAANTMGGANAALNPVANTQQAATDAAQKAGNNADAVKDSLQPKAEAIKDLPANQTEFQRFVAQNTGRFLPLFGYGLFSQPDKYAPVLAAPVPGSYVLGPGDELVLQTYGVVDVSERLIIDRNGRVNIPKVGQVQLAGIPYAEAEKVLNANIGKVYTNYTLSLTMGRLRSIEVFVLGQAARPGKQVVSGLSTLINALFETGGASANGSLRQIELRRGGKTITTVDLYKFLTQGDSSNDTRLQSGDIIYIPPAGERAAILGTINSPAIYELKEGETIADILALSGGLPVLAAPQKAQLERLAPKEVVARYVEDFALDSVGLTRKLKAGDVLTVFQISPQIANVVTLEGNVAAPMRYNFKSGMRVSDILGDPRLLITVNYWLGVNRGANSASPNRPEVNLDYATIQRLDSKGLVTRLLSFSPSKAMAGDARENLELKSGDILTVYGPTQAGPETDDSISIKGEVVGGLKRFPWREGMTLKDLIPSTQWLIDYYQYWQKPSAQNIRNDINWDFAQVTRRLPQTLLTQSIEFNLGQQVMLNSKDANYKPLKLQPGDQILLFTTAQVQVALEKRIQFATLKGEVSAAGPYQLRPGETLLQLLARAGGFTRNAYLYGTSFTRESVRLQQQDNIEAAVRRMEVQINSQVTTISQNQIEQTNSAFMDQALARAQKQTLERFRSLKASGRLALDLDFANVQLPDLILEDGDVISIPHISNFVGVYGAVLAENSFLHKSSLKVVDYIEKAGPLREADVNAALIIRADGTVVTNGANRSLWGNNSLMSSKVHPGDTIFIPEVLDRRSVYNQFIQGAKDWTQLFYQFGLGAAAIKTLKN